MSKKNLEPNSLLIKPIIATLKTKLAAIDTRSTCGYEGDKSAAIEQQAALNVRLGQLQNLLYAEHKHKVLIVLQGMDTGGKDGAIKKVFSEASPQGVRIASFKAPSADELDHDYLWRIHQQAPAKGEIVVFNRSHYEDVLITRVHGWIDDATAKRRFKQIKSFEEMLVEEGTTIFKFFLHISEDEQKQRLQDRLDDPTERWKFNIGDLAERKKWDEYQRVYQEAMNATSCPHAPWYVVPADRKWLRDIYISIVLVNVLSQLSMQYPDLPAELHKVVIE